MIESQRVAALVFDALKADAQFNAAVGGRIYRDQVPQNAALPAALVSVVSGTDSNTLSGNRAFNVTLVDVHLIGSGSSYGSINPAADRADTVLQGRGGVNGGAQIVELRREQVLTMIENEAGATFTHIISTYRTEAYASS